MSRTLTAFSFITIFAICFIGSDSIGVLKIETYKHQGQDATNVICQSNNSIIGEKAMNLQLQILKDGKSLALIQKCRDHVYVSDNGVQAHGRVDRDDDDDNHSFLIMTLVNTTTSDNGEYTCVVHYRDDLKFLKMTSASQNLTFQTDDVSSVLQLWNEVKDLKGQLDFLKDKMSRQPKRESEVSFTAGFDDTKQQIRQHETVVFSKVIKQQGRGYDSSTGVFTAPRKGIYTFHLTIMTGSEDNWMNIDLVVNGNVEARLRGGDDTHYDQSTVSAVVVLEGGNEVRAIVSSMHPEMNIFRYPWSVFSGYLLTTL